MVAAIVLCDSFVRPGYASSLTEEDSGRILGEDFWQDIESKTLDE